MNIVTQFNNLLEKSFNIFLKKYFKDSNYCDKDSNIINYVSFMTDLDKFSTTFILDIIKSYFEYIDNIFFNSSYRKNFCSSKGFFSSISIIKSLSAFCDINCNFSFSLNVTQ